MFSMDTFVSLCNQFISLHLMTLYLFYNYTIWLPVLNDEFDVGVIKIVRLLNFNVKIRGLKRHLEMTNS